MPEPMKSGRELRRRVDELETQLAEASATLQAIRDGEVDAFVVHGAGGERIYALTSADRTYRTLIEEMREGALTLARDGLILFANRRFGEMVGLASEKIAGTWLREYVAERDNERVSATKRGNCANHPSIEVTVQGRGGEPIPALLAFNDLPPDSGDHICLIVTDLREQKRAVEVMAAEALARAVLDQAVEAVVVVDPEGQIVRASRAASELSRAPVLWRPIAEALPLVFPAGSPFREIDALHNAVRGGRIFRGLEAMLPREGGSCDLMVSAGPVVCSLGSIVGCVFTLTDVTLRKQVEARTREAQKMESVGVLAAGIAHDFNNLMTGVVGNASLAAELVPAHLRSTLEEISVAGLQAADLTRQLLAYAGKGRFIVERVDLADTVLGAIPLLRHSLKKAQMKLNLDGPPPIVEADRSQMQQVIMNLAINAAEAIGDAPGEIAVTASIASVDETAAALHGAVPCDYAVLEVRDTGCGMDEATRAKIFDPFFTTRFLGRGLGLAAVAGIVRGCRGWIDVESRPGQGATFRVFLPSVPAEKKPGRPPSEGEILVADDEPVVRHVAAKALEHYGFSVVPAENGLQAVELFEAAPHRFEVVVLDIKMPGMDGFETLRRLKELNPEVKVLVSTGFEEPEARSYFEREGVAGFLQKPYTAAALAKAIRGAMQK
jgi:two-component system, cell cycle sensor histidine kinase and response regulator CckA